MAKRLHCPSGERAGDAGRGKRKLILSARRP